MSSEKQTRRKPAKKEKPVVKAELTLRTTVDVASLVEKVRSEVEKGAVKYYTPYTLAQALGIKISDAKKVLREATRLGILKLYSGGRRSPIYVPAK